MGIERPSRRTVATLLGVALVSLLLDLVFGAFRIVRTNADDEWPATATVGLPDPDDGSDVSVEEAIAARRSRREFAARSLDLEELGQLLWATQGVTDRRTGFRAAPSAGALYPLEVYVVVGDPGVDGLERGIYRYVPETHELERGARGNVQAELRRASVDQAVVEEAAVDVVVFAVDERTTQKYGVRGERRYIPMEAGHAGENLYLQAESLGLATVSVGAFGDARVREIVGAPADQRPLYIFPVGERA